MRVAMLNNPVVVLDPNMAGGVERIALLEIEHLAKRGVEARYFVRGQVSPHPNVEAMKDFKFGGDFGRDYYAWFEERSKGYDIQHGHNTPLLAIISKHPRPLIHVHNLMSLPYYEVASSKYHRCSFAFCSDFIRGKFLGDHPDLPPERCHTIHNGIDLQMFHPADSGSTGGGRLRVLFAGVWLQQKGIYDFLEAVRILEGKRYDFEAIVAGSPFLYKVGDPLAWQLEAEKRVTDTVKGLKRARVSRLNYSEMPGLYRSADVFVFPSTWDEPFGISIVEAMASGVPVVATRVGGIPEIVQDGKTGALIPPGDPQSMSDAIGRLLDNEGARRQLGAQGRRVAEDSFSIDAHVDKLLALYGKLMSEPARST
jgi:glycosyltransferase involved in cell wall biosynthesis